MISANDAKQLVRAFNKKSSLDKEKEMFLKYVNSIEEEIEKYAMNGKSTIRYKIEELCNLIDCQYSTFDISDEYNINKLISFFKENGFDAYESLPYEDGEEYYLVISWI